MERLISEASQMTEVQKELGITVADGDMSFANIANAISVVQKNMGLMGTTASEASGTISGSTGSMQSAWQNLVTGIADDNANFEVLVDNLVTSIVGKDGEGGFINNMLPRIQQALDGIVKMVVSLTDTLLPQIVVIGTDLIANLVSSIGANLPALLESANTIINTLISGIVNLLPQLIPMAVSIILTLTTSILEMLPEILQAGITVLIELVKGITQALPELIPTMVRVVMDMVNILLDNIDVIIECGIVLLVALTDGIMNALPELMSRLPEIIIKIVSTLMQLSPQLMSASLRIIVSLATGLVKYIPEMISRIPQIIKSMVDAFKQGVTDFMNIGKNLIEGIWNGISDAGAWLKDKVSGFFGGVVDDIKGFFGIHSPSTLFENEIGKNLALGVGEGFSSTMSDVSADMQGAIPTEFDTNVNMNASSSSYGSNYDYLVTAFKEALKGVRVVMNNREMGAFILNTVEREVYT
jgi:phage-related protein